MQLLVNIDVPELEVAEAFYEAAFGLRRQRRLGEGASELSGAPCPVYLLENAEGTRTADESRRYGRHWCPIHCDVIVDDVEAALARAVAAGARPEGDIRDTAYGRIVTISDPFGHGWCLLQFTGRGYDELA